jgi:hypothetical protein
MISQVRAGGLAVVFCVSVVLVSGDAFARGGGFGARGFTGRSAAFGFHSPPFGPRAQLHAHVPGIGVPVRRHLGLGFLPLTGFGGGYYPGFAPPEYAVPSDRPVEVERDITGAIPPPLPLREAFRPPLPFIPLVPGCPTQTVTVPAKDGGETTINILRC